MLFFLKIVIIHNVYIIYTWCMIQVKVFYFVTHNSTEIKPIELRDVLPKPDVIPGRVGRRTKRQISGQTQTSVEGKSLIRRLGFVWYPAMNSFFFSLDFIFLMHSCSLYVITLSDQNVYCFLIVFSLL